MLLGDIELKMQCGNFVARMIVGIRELGHPIKQLCFCRRSLVNTRKKINHVDAGFPGSLERERHIALRIKAANISHVSVIVRRRIKIVVLGPADPLQMNRYRSSGRTGGWLHAHDGRLNGKVSAPERLPSVAQFDSMLSAEIEWDRQRKLDLSILAYTYFRDRFFLRRKSVAAYPASHVRLPEKIQSRVGRKAFPTQNRSAFRGPLRWSEAQLSTRHVDFGIRQRIRPVFVRIRSRRRGPTGCRAKCEFGTRQIRVGRLLKVEITLTLPS